MSHSPFVAGDIDWHEYYKKHASLDSLNKRVHDLERLGGAGGSIDLSDIISRLEVLEKSSSVDLTSIEKRITALEKEDIKDDETDTKLQNRIANLNDELSELKSSLIMLEQKVKNLPDSGSSVDLTRINEQIAELQMSMLELKGKTEDTSELDKLKKQVEELKKGGYDTTDLEKRISALESGAAGDFGGNVNLVSMNERLKGLESGTSGSTAQLFSRVNALEHGDSGQVASNKSEIGAIKQRLDAAGI